LKVLRGTTMDRDNNSDWGEWSRHVLTELKRLNTNYESLRTVNEEIRQEMYRISTIETNISELREWKSRVDNSLTPNQMVQLSEKVNELEKFKIKAITVWAVIQSITMIAVGFIKYLF
jgi:DNA repair exonuclease SbcCD ATPase subunit